MTDNPFFKPENPKASQQLLSLAQRRGIPGNVFGHKIFRGTFLYSDLSQNETKRAPFIWEHHPYLPFLIIQ